MADLDNLLDDINNDDGSDVDDDYEDQQNIPVADGFPARSGVPSALAAAAARRRQLGGNDALGAGEEERDYRAAARFGGANYNEEGDDGDDDDDDGDGRNYNPDYETLKALWTSEMACPELLPHDAETVLQIVEELSGKEEVIDELLQRSRRQGQQQQSREATGELASLMAQITKMDSDRTRFMLVDLARTRMAKIENHALHNRILVDRMTEEERSYLRQYGELLEKHYRRTVLDHLPKDAWKKLDEPEMIDSPDLEQFVFCRVVETVQIDVRGDLGVLNEDLANDEDDFGDNIQEHAAGSYLIVMYKQVRDLVLEGKVELLM